MQPEPFYSGRDLYTLDAKVPISLKIKLFITTVIEANRFRYNYGRQANKTLPFIELKLPIKHNPNGSVFIDENRTYSTEGFVPDWQFMEDYIKTLHHKPLTTNNKPTNQIINTTKWEEFSMTRLFDIKRGSITSLNEIDDGNVPIVSSSGDNEGVSFYGNVPALYNNKTISMNGATGFTAYHCYDFNINVDCCVLLEKFEMNKYIGLFLVTIIELLRYKYSYGRKMSAERIKTEVIKLPVKFNYDGSVFIDENHTYSDKGFVPDWQFMENYIKSLPYGDRI